MDFQRLIEEKLREAFAEGAFDNLPGKGQPLKLEAENPFEDPTQRMGYRVLRNNGFTLPWIQEQKEIAEESERLRTELTRAWHMAERARATGADAWQTELRWRKAATTFRRQVAELNERIRHYNWQTPSDRFQRLPLDAEREIERIAQPLALTELSPATASVESEPPASNTVGRRLSLRQRVQRLWRKFCAWLAGEPLRRVGYAAQASA